MKDMFVCNCLTLDPRSKGCKKVQLDNYVMSYFISPPESHLADPAKTLAMCCTTSWRDIVGCLCF